MPVKLIMLGDTCVGKTSFVSKYINHTVPKVHKSTIGAAMSSKQINHNSTSFNLHIWDTAGQERYSSLTTLYYKSSNIAIIMYDITNPESFIKAQNYICSVREKGPDDIIMGLIGNKSDIAISDPEKRAIPYSVGKDCADTHDILFAETNVFNDNDVKCVFGMLIDQLPEHALYPDRGEDEAFLDNIMNCKRVEQNDCCTIV